jgi:outer membrane receptor protein involved in Fe transport
LLGTFVNDLTGDQFIVYGDDFSARLPDYSRFDIGVKYNLLIKDDILSLGAGVYNLFGRNNISRRSYDVSFTGDGDTNLNVDIRDLELLGISPNFSITYLIK